MSHHMHRMSGSDAVGEQRFLPWHRDYLLKLAKAMQQTDPGSFIPYWEWSTDRGIPPWMTGFTPTVAIPAVPMSPAHTVTVKRHPHLPAGLPTVQQITSLDQNTNLDFEQF